MDIFEKESAKYILNSINNEVPKSEVSRFSIAQTILSSFVNKASGVVLLSLVDNISIGLTGLKTRKSLSDLIHGQVSRVERNSSVILTESQINLMATACVTDYLVSLESGSWDNGVKNVGKIALGLLEFKNPLNELLESVSEISDRYGDVYQVYHVAFLLNIYNSVPDTEDIIKSLIIETLCDDCDGVSSVSAKKRFLLFSDVQYKTLNDNLKHRLGYMLETCQEYSLYDPFIKCREDYDR